MILPPSSGLDAATRLAVAALAGLAVGIERQRSGQASGPAAHFAGLRTFFILGLTGGLAGLLSASGQSLEATVFLAAGAALVVAAFVLTLRRPGIAVDGTTEVAALAMLGLGFLAGGGQLALAAGTTAVVVLALGEKRRLHGMVARIDTEEWQAAALFGVMALVILPLLPATPLPWGGEISLRGLWWLVLLFTAINFGGYLAHRAVGAERGYGIAGLLGGVISSTLVTLQFARLSREAPRRGEALSLGVVAACTVLPIRLLTITAVLAPAVALAALPYLLPPAVVGVALVSRAFGGEKAGKGPGEETVRSPLRVVSSVRMVALFWVALVAIDWLRAQWGSTGVLTSAVLLGLTDMDALTVAMTRLGGEGGVALAARGIGVGVISNTVFKLGIALTLGGGVFRRRVAVGLMALGAAVGAGWLL